ncbi:MAG TPA: response regulator [Thermoanaerobaculia bacterium]|jgi:CheY-like chemotaxis protein|nr:response regulator [Thermoanaerobaculia bacterium]
MPERPVILVVDDDAPILLLMRSLLREFGFEPVAAGSGEEAIAAARQRTPDLILLDRNMPGMNGDEVLRELRANDELSAVPIFIVSGEPLGPDEVRRLGATGHVLKPFDVPSLVATIRNHVSAN